MELRRSFISVPVMTPAALVALALFLPGCDPGKAEPPAPAGILQARAFYASQPRFLRPVPYSPVPKGLPDLRAETCGKCHVDIYNEWRISTHARAWLDDAQYLEELKKTTAVPGRDGSWICMNCHTPVEAQLPRLVSGLEDGNLGRPIYVDNPYFDAVLQDEAITCAACHVRDGTVLGPYGDTVAPHPVRQSAELLSPDVCTQCHEAEATLDDIELACVFDTGTSYAAGPYAAEGITCQQCHMPEVERPMATNAPVRKTRRHWFGGSRVPKHPDFEAELAPMHEAYPDGARIEWVDRPESAAAGARTTLHFAVTNAEAGHSLPTGDVERFLLISARVVDEAGDVLAERTERFGTHFQWEPVVVKLGDNRLAPRETRTFAVDFKAPARGTVSLHLEGQNHRISAENFEYHELEGRSVASRVFFFETAHLQVR